MALSNRNHQHAMKPQSRGTGCVHCARPDQWGGRRPAFGPGVPIPEASGPHSAGGSLKHREEESFRAELLADALDEARFFGERAGFGGERGPGVRTAALRFFSFSRNLWHTIRIMEVQHGCPLRPRNRTLTLSPSARSSLSNRVLAAAIIPTTNLLNRCRPISK